MTSLREYLRVFREREREQLDIVIPSEPKVLRLVLITCSGLAQLIYRGLFSFPMTATQTAILASDWSPDLNSGL